MVTSREKKSSKTSQRVERRYGVDEDIMREKKLGKRNHGQNY